MCICHFDGRRGENEEKGHTVEKEDQEAEREAGVGGIRLQVIWRAVVQLVHADALDTDRLLRNNQHLYPPSPPISFSSPLLRATHLEANIRSKHDHVRDQEANSAQVDEPRKHSRSAIANAKEANTAKQCHQQDTVDRYTILQAAPEQRRCLVLQRQRVQRAAGRVQVRVAA